MSDMLAPGFRWNQDVVLNDKRLEAAYEIMADVHTGVRKSGQPDIEHPILVYNLLSSFGCDDVQKAVGLLHDVREDGKEYDTAEKIHIKLSQKLMEKCSPQTADEAAALEQWAKEVCSGIEQLTNGAYLYEGKRTWQVDHVRTIAGRFKPVKILDQAASVISDGIRSANPDYLAHFQKWEAEKGFARKGFDVVTACMPKNFTTSDPLYRLYYFYMQVHTYFDEMYRLARGHQEGKDYKDGEVKLRQAQFDIPTTISNTSAIRWTRPLPVKAENVTHRFHPAFADDASPDIALPQKGLVRVTLSRKTGKVVGIGVIIAAQSDAQNPANAMASALRYQIESHERQRVVTGEPVNSFTHAQGIETYESKNMAVRDFTIGPPLALETFIQLAKQAGAIDAAFESQLHTVPGPSALQQR